MRYFFPLFLIAVLLSSSGCGYYQRYSMAQTRLTRINTDGLTFYLLDPARPLSGVWYVEGYKFNEDNLTAVIIRLPEQEALEVVTVSNSRDARQSRNEVLLYAKPSVARAFSDSMRVDLRYDQLEKVEVYEMNYGKTLATNFMGYIAFGLVLTTLISKDN